MYKVRIAQQVKAVGMDGTLLEEPIFADLDSYEVGSKEEGLRRAYLSLTILSNALHEGGAMQIVDPVTFDGYSTHVVMAKHTAIPGGIVFNSIATIEAVVTEE